jgi:hypothetical protein
MTRLEVLRPFVEQTVKEYLGVEELMVNEDGTIPIRAGSTAPTTGTTSCRRRSVARPSSGAPTTRTARKGRAKNQAIRAATCSAQIASASTR